jgi:hypothetical protein
MKPFALLASAIIAFAIPVFPQQKVHPHPSREAAIQLLRREGILHGKTRVDSTTWINDFWIVSLRHADGKITNWTVVPKRRITAMCASTKVFVTQT